MTESAPCDGSHCPQHLSFKTSEIGTIVSGRCRCRPRCQVLERSRNKIGETAMFIVAKLSVYGGCTSGNKRRGAECGIPGNFASVPVHSFMVDSFNHPAKTWSLSPMMKRPDHFPHGLTGTADGDVQVSPIPQPPQQAMACRDEETAPKSELSPSNLKTILTV